MGRKPAAGWPKGAHHEGGGDLRILRRQGIGDIQRIGPAGAAVGESHLQGDCLLLPSVDGDGAIAEVAVLLGGHHVAYGDPVVLIGGGEHIVGSAGAIQNGKGRYGEVPEVRRLATAV